MSQVESIHLDAILVKYPRDVREQIEKRIEKFKEFARKETIGFTMLEYITFCELEKLGYIKVQ